VNLVIMRGGRTTVRLEKGFEPVEVTIHEHPQAKPRASDVLPLPQHQTVMTGLFDAAEIERVVFFRGQDEADHFLVKLPACGEVADGEDDVAGAGDAKSRIEIRGGEAHSRNLLFASRREPLGGRLKSSRKSRRLSSGYQTATSEYTSCAPVACAFVSIC